MKVYRRVLNIVVVVAMAAMMVGCAARPKNISSRGLVSLFKEFLLVNAYATDVLYLSARDSVDLYTPVLEKHGYTIEDFEYTIDNLTKRKSAQISDIMEVAISELKLEADERRILWNYWSKMIDKGKELAMDTIVVDSLLDSKKIGEKGMRLYFEDLKPGSYRIDYNYFITARTYGERVYAELRDVADSTHTINQWSLRVDDTVKGSHRARICGVAQPRQRHQGTPNVGRLAQTHLRACRHHRYQTDGGADALQDRLHHPGRDCRTISAYSRGT